MEKLVSYFRKISIVLEPEFLIPSLSVFPVFSVFLLQVRFFRRTGEYDGSQIGNWIRRTDYIMLLSVVFKINRPLIEIIQ